MAGCGGCGRKKRKAITSKQKIAMRQRSKAAIAAKQQRDKSATKFRNKLIKARLNICEKCPHSIQNDRDKKFNIRLCHKQNRPINIVAKLLSTACPLSKFQATT